MATQTSSLIGADLSGLGGSTALFALGSVASGTGGSEWQYVEATATFVTGEIVLVNPTGTAKTLISSLLTAGTEGYDIGFVQSLVNQGEFGWVAKRGRGLYVLVTGTLTAGSDNGLALGANSGRLVAGTAGGNTLFGVWLTTGISGGASAIQATMQWPRILASGVSG
jgi:hypothetical protein